MSKIWAGTIDSLQDGTLVRVSFVAFAHDNGEGTTEGSTGPVGQTSPSGAASLIGDMSAVKVGDLLGREKFSTDLDSLMLGVAIGGGLSFGGG